MAELYHDDRPDITEIEIDNDDGPLIMREEVKATIDDMKAEKDFGAVGVAAEVLQALGDFVIDQLTSFFR